MHYSWKEDIDFAGRVAGYTNWNRKFWDVIIITISTITRDNNGRRMRLSNKVKDFVSCRGIARRFQSKVIVW
jgi:hypothetical protein